MARVSRDAVLLVDTLNMGEDGEQAEALRDPSHVRNYTEDEWRAMVAAAGLEIEELVVLPHTIDFPAWLERTACTGETAQRVRELWGARVDGRPPHPRQDRDSREEGRLRWRSSSTRARGSWCRG